MKKIAFISLLFCLALSAQAQNISFFDLTNLTNLSDGEAHTYLTLGKIFKQDYIQQVGENTLEVFKTVNPKIKEQTVTIGNNTKLPNGNILHNITYTTRDPQHVVNLISQAKRSRMILKFEGLDANNNIYIFDSEFYRVAMYISTTGTSGVVEIHQKDFSN